MNHDEMTAYLLRDGGAVPCSRYGRNSEDCAPVAIALAEIYEEAKGEETTTEDLDYFMGLVVNDHDDVLSLILDHGTDEHRALIADVIAEHYEQAAEIAGAEAGRAAGTWVIDGTTTEETARRILRGIDDGDPEILDMQPAPLSGEYAGESVSELSERFGIPLDDDFVATAFETAYSEAYWAEVERAARYQVEDV